MNVTYRRDTLNLFNCMVADEGDRGLIPTYLGLTDVGVVLDFMPTAEQEAILREENEPIAITTLFTREQRAMAPLDELLRKQLLHYVEVYGLGAPGLFDLACGDQGEIAVMRFVKGIGIAELETMVHDLLYANAPIKDAPQLKRIIEGYGLRYELNRVENHEMKVVLYNPGVDTFKNGDDAVRYMVYRATGETLLIKSKEVIAAIKKAKLDWPGDRFFTMHANVLAQVFNRHKRLILAAKHTHNRSAINKIARLSKAQHVPVRESIAKTFVHKALTSPVTFDPSNILATLTVRDKMKYLNLLAQKRLHSPVDTFKIRNGKVWTHLDRPTYSDAAIQRVERVVLVSLDKDLSHLKNHSILLDRGVDYGLPVSRKQTLGNLPFGTQVRVDSNEICSGIYWENAWGSSDLDLSTIDQKGNRVGWGQYSGYNDTDIIFSGDLTDASSGAMEFMTSRSAEYGLFVNIFTGKVGSKMELVIGTNTHTRRKWIDEAVIREKHILNSKNTIIGFVRGKTFTVYMGRLDQRRVSDSQNPVLNQGNVDFWTVQKLFNRFGVHYDVDRQPEVVYDYDLSYSSFSYDKLEDLLIAA